VVRILEKEPFDAAEKAAIMEDLYRELHEGGSNTVYKLLRPGD
jgi:hypothetical protein